MGQKDILIGKAVSFGLAGIAVIIFVLGTSKLVGYDAQENGLMTLKEGTFNTEDGNEGYRVYTKHTNCEEVQVEFYYDSFYNMGDLIWDPSCTTGLFEFRPATSGEWQYLGTLTFQSKMMSSTDSNEVTVDFNVSASHEVMLTDREPIEDGLAERNISGMIFVLGVMIYQVTIRTLVDRKMEQNPQVNQQYPQPNQQFQDQFANDDDWY